MPKTILIADDNESVRTVIRLSLQFKGHTLIEVDDGAKALARLGEGGIDLLISDIAMPNMNGLELLDRVRKDDRFKALPVLICSAEEDATEEGMIARGASAFLVKPCRPMDLMQTVDRLLA